MIEDEIQGKLKQIEQIKTDICNLGEIRTGSMSEQWNICGNPSCRCKAAKNPKKHGPYYQLSYTRYRKSSSEFVRKDNVELVRQQLEDYKTFMKLKDDWIDLSIEISRLRKKQK